MILKEEGISMKRMKRLTAVLTAAAMLVMNGTAMPFSGVTASAAGDTQDDWLDRKSVV